MSEISTKVNPLKSAPMAESRQKVTEEKLREVSEMYEKHFIREMMKQMRSTVKEGGFIKQNNAEKIFRDQLDDQYAEQWGKAGGIGLSDLIYNQLIDKFGVQMGLKQAIEKPQGPMQLDAQSDFSGAVRPVRSPPSSLHIPTDMRDQSPVTYEIRGSEEVSQVVTSPWAGTLLDKKYLDADRLQYRIKHENGLESLILIRGTGPGPEHKLSLGDTIEAGQAIGRQSAASPLFWTLKANVSE